MKATIYLTAVVTAAMLGSAAAQTATQTKTQDFTVKVGANVQIGTYYLINTKSCHAGPIPKIVQTSKPTGAVRDCVGICVARSPVRVTLSNQAATSSG